MRHKLNYSKYIQTFSTAWQARVHSIDHRRVICDELQMKMEGLSTSITTLLMWDIQDLTSTKYRTVNNIYSRSCSREIDSRERLTPFTIPYHLQGWQFGQCLLHHRPPVSQTWQTHGAAPWAGLCRSAWPSSMTAPEAGYSRTRCSADAPWPNWEDRIARRRGGVCRAWKCKSWWAAAACLEILHQSMAFITVWSEEFWICFRRAKSEQQQQ